MTDPTSAVYQEFWGGNAAPPPGAPAAAPADAIQLYQGADPARNGGLKAWWSWDIRGWLNRLVWDLLRFQVMTEGKMPADITTPIGLRDSVNVILNLTWQNNQILQRLAKHDNVDISDIVAK